MRRRIDDTMKLLDNHKEDMTKYFCSTRATNKARSLLEEHGHLVLTGVPGSGKTFTALSVIHDFAKLKNLQPICINTASEWEELVDTNARLIVFIDDFVGRYGINEFELKEWRSKGNLILTNVGKDKSFLVITIRKYILHEISNDTPSAASTDQLDNLLNSKVKIDMNSDVYKLSNSEREDILNRYIFADTLVLEDSEKQKMCKAECPIGFPQSCRMIKLYSESKDIVRNFTEPTQFLLADLQRISKENEILYGTLVIAMLCGGSLSLLDFETHIERSNSLLECLGLPPTSRVKVSACAQFACISYLHKSPQTDCYTFVHDTIHAAVFRFFFQRNKCKTLQFCSLQLLSRLCTLEKSGTGQGESNDIWEEVHVPAELYGVVEERFRDALLTLESGSFLNVASAKVWHSEKFWTFLLAKYSTEELISQFILYEDKDRQSLFAYFCQSGRLFPVEQQLHLINQSKLDTLGYIFKKEEALFMGFFKALTFRNDEIVFFLFPRLDVSIDLSMLVTARYGTVEVMKYLLQIEGTLSCKDLTGLSLLHEACLATNKEMVRFLVMEDAELLHTVDKDNLTPLHYAAYAGDVEILQYILQQDVHATDCKETVLHSACAGGKLRTVKYLTDQYPEMVYKAKDGGWSVLHSAARGGNVSVLRHVINCGVDPWSITVNGLTILNVACKKGKLEMVKYLTGKYTNMVHMTMEHDLSTLHSAVLGGNISVVEHLLQCGVDPWCATENSQTILHTACQEGKLEMVQYLTAKYPDMVNKTRDDGWSVLHSACGGHASVLQHLIQCGADPWCTTMDGANILHSACQEGKLETVKYLTMQYSGMVYKPMCNGCSVLHSAAVGGNISVLQHILQCGADPRYTMIGVTILHAACEGGKIGMVKYLTGQYPDMVNKKRDDGWSVLHSAVWGGNSSVVQLILECGVDPWCTTMREETILQVACERGNLEMVKYLTKEFSDMVHKTCSDGWSALHSTPRGGNIGVLEHLIKCGVDPWCKAVTNLTVLDIACSDGKIEMVNYMTNHYFNPLSDAEQSKWINALHHAASKGNNDVLQHLLHCGVYPWRFPMTCWKIFMCACRGGNFEMVKQLTDKHYVVLRLAVEILRKSGQFVLRSEDYRYNAKIIHHLLQFYGD